MNPKSISTIVLVLIMILSSEVYGKIWYVNDNASGNNDGSSWTDAYTDLQSALGGSFSGDTIWVAAGLYKPTTGTDRSIYFNLKSGISIFGGFAGTETSVDQRDLGKNISTLSGDIGTINYTNDNSNVILYASNVSTQVIIDGFRVTAGAGGSGAGLYTKSSKVYVRNCRFVYNVSGKGGAIYQEFGDLRIENCLFDYNTVVSNTGAAISSENSGNVTILNSEFYSNQADPSSAGAVIFATGMDNVIIRDCILAGNDGKKSIIQVGNSSNLEMKNLLIAGNYIQSGEFVSIGNYSSAKNNIINCTIAHNLTDSSNLQGSKPVLRIVNKPTVNNVINCIIYDNVATDDIFTYGKVENCVLERGFNGGSNNVTGDPMFVKPGSLTNAPFMLNGLDYSLKTRSPGIDIGNNAYIKTGDSLDLNGNKRIYGPNVDAGAYENMYCKLLASIKRNRPNDLCLGDSAILTIDSGNYWLWDNQVNAKSITVSSTGRYSALVIDTTTGCRGIVEDSVTFHPFSVTISGNDRFCEGDSSILTANGNNSSLLWSTSDTTKSITVTDSAVYKVVALSEYGCISTDSVQVIVDTLPVATISITDNTGLKNDDGIICAGYSITLEAHGGSGYVWSDSSTNSKLQLVPLQDTVYSVKAVNSFGCENWSSSVRIEVNPLPVPSIQISEESGVNSNDGVICKGDSVFLETQDYLAYSWSTGDKNRGITLVPSATKNYLLTVTDTLGCQNNASATVVVNDLPTPIIQRSGNNLITGNYKYYQWYLNGNKLSGVTAQGISPNVNGKYVVWVEDNSGCSAFSPEYNLTDLGIGAVEKVSVFLYPNPSTGTFVIQGLSSPPLLIQIFNQNGCLIDVPDPTLQEYNISALPEGLYLVRVMTSEGLYQARLILY